MSSTKTFTLSSERRYDEIMADCRNELEEQKATVDEIAPFLDCASSILDSFYEFLGEGVEVRYRVFTRFRKVRLSFDVQGEKHNPIEIITESRDGVRENELKPLLRNESAGFFYTYRARHNYVVLSSPRLKPKSMLNSPMLWAPIIGLVCGLLCMHLPEGMRSTLINDIATPVKTVALNLLLCVMGPVILVSMVTAVSALKSVNDLTNMGFKLIGRFISVILSVMAVGIVVSLLFFSVFGSGNVSLRTRDVIDLILGIFPKDPISPLMEGNTPQLVVMGLVMGAAFIIPSNELKELKEVLNQIGVWIMSVLDIAQFIMPVIPFCSIFIAVAGGAGASLLSGWEFIVAMYLATSICAVIKFVRVALKYKIKASLLWGKLKPLVMLAFTSGNITTIMKQEYEFCEDKLGVTPEYTSFWIPMSQAMLSPRATLNFVIPPFLILKATDGSISLMFLLILILITLELSIADPGTAVGWTILFTALGLSSDFVGMYLTYELFTANYNAAYGALQLGLEAIESAYQFNAIDMSYLHEEEG